MWWYNEIIYIYMTGGFAGCSLWAVFAFWAFYSLKFYLFGHFSFLVFSVGMFSGVFLCTLCSCQTGGAGALLSVLDRSVSLFCPVLPGLFFLLRFPFSFLFFPSPLSSLQIKGMYEEIILNLQGHCRDFVLHFDKVRQIGRNRLSKLKKLRQLYPDIKS